MKDTDDKPNVYSWNPCTKFKQGTNCEDALVSHFKFDFGLDKPEFCNSSLNCVLQYAVTCRLASLEKENKGSS